ncbi:hypothetical protein SMMN14_08907 [Sphaerulina musiva]
MGLPPAAVIVIALVSSGAAVLIAFALSSSYMKARRAEDDQNRLEMQSDQRGYMNDVRDRNKQMMMMENGYGVYRGGGGQHLNSSNAMRYEREAGGRGEGMVRPEMHARTETEGSSDVLG